MYVCIYESINIELVKNLLNCIHGHLTVLT